MNIELESIAEQAQKLTEAARSAECEEKAFMAVFRVLLINTKATLHYCATSNDEDVQCLIDACGQDLTTVMTQQLSKGYVT